MKSKRGFLPIAAALLSLAASAELGSACRLPETGPNEKVGRLCMAEMPGSRGQCQNYLAELASIESRSLEQTIALAFGRAFVSQFEDDRIRAIAEAELAARELLRPLIDAAPNHPMLLYAYSSFHHDDEMHYREILRNVLRVDPACTWAAFWLSESLGDEGAAIEEAIMYLGQGYEHAEGTRKLLFAREKYERLTYRSAGEAETFRDQVATDMTSREFPMDAENRARSLEVLCNGNALLLRLEALCESAIGELAARDRLAGAPLGHDVLDAVDALSASAEDGELGNQGTKYAQVLLQLLQAEPERLRSAQFYVIYSRVLRMTAGDDAEAEALRRAFELDPASGEIGLYLAGALERAGGPANDIAEVYRHVIVNSDDRTTEEGLPADYYVKYAAKYLRELEAEEKASAESPPSRR